MQAKILIVDDSPGNVQLLSGILSPYYEICFATGGAQCLDLIARQEFDVILLDVVMPDMDGFEVCRQLKADPLTQDIPVIFVTTEMGVEDEALGFELGAVDYIVKPVSPPTVLARVKTHLELKRQRDYLRQLTHLDGLTGIANRRRFDEALKTEWQRARRNRRPLSLLLMDIDHFKRFNDTHGHLAGDQCLKRVAETLQSVARRPGDLVARYGGEEFVCVLPDCDAAGVREVAGNSLRSVENLMFQDPALGTAVKVTMSIGAATVIPHGDMIPATLVKTADTLLYQAKEQGRNRFMHESIEQR